MALQERRIETMKVDITQLTPRGSGSITGLRVHFTYTMDVGGDTISGSGAMTLDEFSDHVDFEGLADAIRQKLADSM